MYETGFVVSIGSDAETEAISKTLKSFNAEGMNGVTVEGKDGCIYMLISNFASYTQTFDPSVLTGRWYDVSNNSEVKISSLSPDEAILLKRIYSE